MLNDASGFKRIFLAAGFTDLRRGIDGLAGIIQFQFELDPHDKDTIFYSYGAFTLQ
jgi:transposase